MGQIVGLHSPVHQQDLNLIMESKYKHLDQKIEKLTKSQTNKPRTTVVFDGTSPTEFNLPIISSFVHSDLLVPFSNI